MFQVSSSRKCLLSFSAQGNIPGCRGFGTRQMESEFPFTYYGDLEQATLHIPNI